MSPIIYLSDYASCSGSGNIETGAGYDSEPFAKYGFELPNFSYVRYRIPVRAGKTYYVGGRGTKNGFVGIQFEGMPANYDPSDYAKNENHILDTSTDQYEAREGNDIISTPKKTRPSAPSGIRGSYNTSADYKMYHLYDNVDASYTGGEANNALLKYDEDQKKFKDVTSGTYLTDNLTMDVTLHRNFTAGYWHPIVLPFSVSETRMRELFGDKVAVIYLDPYEEAMSVKESAPYSNIYPAIRGDVLRFTRHYYQMLYANTPAFICPGGTKKDGTEFETVDQIVFNRVRYQGCDIKSYDIGGGYEIAGSYGKNVLNGSDNDYYYMSNSTDKVASIYHLAEGKTATMKPTRVWIQKNSNNESGKTLNAPVRLNSVGFNSYEGEELENAPEEAGIYDIIADEVTISGYEDDTVYDMLGRIVAKGGTEDLAPGIYIYQGRKVVVK